MLNQFHLMQKNLLGSEIAFWLSFSKPAKTAFQLSERRTLCICRNPFKTFAKLENN